MSTPVGDDERALWDALCAGEQPRYAGARLGIPPRRVQYLCLKWARKRIYDYGVVHDLGWLIPEHISQDAGRGIVRVFNHVAQAQDFSTGKPCDPDGANHEGSNKWCHYEEPHDHGGFDCDATCPCRQERTDAQTDRSR